MGTRSRQPLWGSRLFDYWPFDYWPFDYWPFDLHFGDAVITRSHDPAP